MSGLELVEPLAGFITGVLVGLTGIGGAILMTPFLLLLGVAPAVAVGTDLVFGGVTKALAVWRHGRAGRVRWDWAAWSLATALPAAWVGSYLAWRLHLGGAEPQVILRHLLGAVLVMASVALVAGELLRTRQPVPWGPGAARADTPYSGATAGVPSGVLLVAGAIIGFLVGLTSVGSGSLFMVVLLLARGVSPVQMVGTDLAFGAFLVGGAALAHGLQGTVDWGLAARLLIGAVPGVLLGSRLVGLVPPRVLRTGLAACVLLSGLRLVAA